MTAYSGEVAAQRFYDIRLASPGRKVLAGGDWLTASKRIGEDLIKNRVFGPFGYTDRVCPVQVMAPESRPPCSPLGCGVSPVRPNTMFHHGHPPNGNSTGAGDKAGSPGPGNRRRGRPPESIPFPSGRVVDFLRTCQTNTMLLGGGRRWRPQQQCYCPALVVISEFIARAMIDCLRVHAFPPFYRNFIEAIVVRSFYLYNHILSITASQWDISKNKKFYR